MQNIALHFKENILTTIASCTLHLRALKKISTVQATSLRCIILLLQCVSGIVMDLLNLAESLNSPWRKGTDV